MKQIIYAFLLVGVAISHANAQILINEYSCANLKQFLDSYQKAEDWVELYNTSNETVSLSGWYFSDDEDEPQKWAFPSNTSIPANGFLKMWCSGRNTVANNQIHTNFKLSQTKNNADVLTLTKPNGSTADKTEVQKTQLGQSRGRLPDGGQEWRIFGDPTFNSGSNTNATKVYLTFAARPSMNLDAGFYKDSVTVVMTNNEPNSVLRYTLNGTEPTENAPEYTNPIVVKKTTVIKAKSFSNNAAIFPSFIQFNTYFINEDHSLWVISVAGDTLLNLANGAQSLRPIGTAELFGKDKIRKTRSYGELNSHGQDSWVNDQRSLDWVSRDEMGYSAALKEKIFATSDRDEFQRLILRASGDDNYPDASGTSGSAHIRDAYIHNLADRGKLNLDLRRSEKTIVYLNGNYWGVYDFRELPDDHDYTDYYYDQGKFDIQYILTWGNTWAEYGGTQALANWQSLYNYIQNNQMTDQAKYNQVASQYDVTSLADYIIANGFTVCSDWLNYNTGWWRGLNQDGGHKKWGYILWDNDATFGHYINYTGIPDTSPYAEPCDPETLNSQWSDPKGHIKTLKKLRTNPEFNQYYITRMADLMNTTFGCENMLAYLDTIINTIKPEMTRHIERWGGSMDEWEANVYKMRHFITLRCDLLPEGLKDCYNLNGPYPTVITVDPPAAASALQVNSIHYDNQTTVTGNYFGGIGTKLVVTPTANTNWVFDKWTAKNNTFSDPFAVSTLVNLTVPDTIVATFKIASSTEEPVKPQPSVLVYPTVVDNGDVNIDYILPTDADVTIRVHSSMGQLMGTVMATTNMSEGNHTAQFTTRSLGLTPGVWFIEFNAGDWTKTVKLVKM